MGAKRGSAIDDFMNSPLFNGDSGFRRSPGAQREQMIQRMLERNISELAMNRFKWENLPESVDGRFVELNLLLNGLCVWYWDDGFDKLVATQGAAQGYMNYTQNPVSFTVIGPGTQVMGSNATLAYTPKTLGAYIPQIHKGKEEAKRKGIAMWPNFLRSPDIDIVMIYSTRLATVDRTLEINTKNARRNKVVTANSNNQLSMANISRQQDEGVEQIMVKDSANIEDAINVLDLGILPDSYEKLAILRRGWWNECMGLLGIDNANQDKKERLVAQEVSANDGQTDSMRYVALQARQFAASQINEVFGTNISVEFNVEVEAQAKAAAEQTGITQGGE